MATRNDGCEDEEIIRNCRATLYAERDELNLKFNVQHGVCTRILRACATIHFLE